MTRNVQKMVTVVLGDGRYRIVPAASAEGQRAIILGKVLR